MIVTINQEWRTVSPGGTSATIDCRTGIAYRTEQVTR
jgi:hypothetical protein